MLNNKFFDHIKRVEGGWSDHPSDSGGATMLGITKRTYESWLGHSVTKNDLRGIPKKTVLDIYEARYYDVNRTDQFENEFVQLALFDQSVNRGYRSAAKMLQETANLYGKRLSVDGRVGNMTLAAVNSIDPKEFGMDYVQRAQHGYVNIVKNRNSQLVFLSGWMNRTHALLDDYVGYIPTVIGTSAKVAADLAEDFEDDLFSKIVRHNSDISKIGLTRALTFMESSSVKNKKYMTFVDFDMRSSKKRLFLIDLETGKAERHKVAHGRYSDLDNDGYGDAYSNKPGSGMSSLGAMVIDKPYGKIDGGWSKFPTAITIHGLEKGRNDNVRKRAVVFHSSKYVDDFNKSLSGRSLGCFAVDDAIAQSLQAKIKGGSLIYAHDKDFLKAS